MTGNQCEMDIPTSTKVVYDRIHKLEPDLANKIIGYLLLQDDADREMIRLAFGPDPLIHTLIAKAKLGLNLIPNPATSAPIQTPNGEVPIQFTPFPPAPSRPFSSAATLRVAPPYWDPLVIEQQIHNMDFVHPSYSHSISDDYRFHSQPQLLGLEDQLENVNPSVHDFPSNYFYPDATLGSVTTRSSRRSPSLPEFPLKVCHYFHKGYCKHGSSCRYYHGQPAPDSFSQIFSPNSNDVINDDHFLPGSLEKLELELTELLKSRRGCPVSIASLPLLYQEKYGRTLQAEGYLTESQRHGKAGYSLTKLLARLKNSIRLIDRPHGQHAVILAEDAPRYMEYRSERGDSGGVASGSRQIYLTFPAESTFTEEDVSNYFMNFGPVQDVRIPCQQKRMFGFVTFLYPETVKTILMKGNPHFVCGARVLVKQYRDKTRIADRKYSERNETPLYYHPSHFLDMDAELQAAPRMCNASKLLRKQFFEDHEQALELEARRLSELQLAQRPPSHQPYFGFSIDDLKVSEGLRDHNGFQASDRFNYFFDVLNNGSTSDDIGRHSSTNNYSDQETSQGLNLPESPFASQIGSSISTVT